jgi:hypothetical protein
MTDVAANPRLSVLGAWWQTLSPETQGYFNSMAGLNPQLVGEVLGQGDGSWMAGFEASGGDLGRLFTETAGELPSIAVVSELVFTPDRPDPGVDVVVTWTEQNVARADATAYTSRLTVTDPSGAVLTSIDVPRGGLAGGGSETVTATIPGAVIPSVDSYYVAVYTNYSDETVAGQLNANGGLGGTAGYLNVGGADVTRPSSPGAANMQGIAEALSSMGVAGDRVTPSAMASVVQALYSFAAVPADDEQARIVAAAQALERVADLNDVVGPEQFNDLFAEKSAAFQGALYALQSSDPYEPNEALVSDAVNKGDDLGRSLANALGGR